MKQLIILGSNGWYPSNNKQTTCVLMYNGVDSYVIDAGTGILNLYEYKDILEKSNHIYFILSHYHYDHTVGLTYLDDLNIYNKSSIYGPIVNDKQAKDILLNIYQTPFVPYTITKTLSNVNILSYTQNQKISLGNETIQFFKNIHTDDSYSIAMGDILVSTDNNFSKMSHNLTQYKIVMCEIWDLQKRTPFGHTSFENIKAYYKENQERLKSTNIYAIHQNPKMTSLQEEEYCNALKNIGLIPARDHMSIQV